VNFIESDIISLVTRDFYKIQVLVKTVSEKEGGLLTFFAISNLDFMVS